MTTKVVTIMFDNSVQHGSYDFTLNVPWPSVMTLRQVELHDDGTLVGVVLVGASWVPDGGLLCVCHDGTSVSPQTKFIIRNTIQGTQTIKLFTTGAANALFVGNGDLGLQLEFTPLESAEEKKSK